MLLDWLRQSFEISHTSHQSIKSMEGIRGFAVFLVFLVHFTTLVYPWLAHGTLTYTISESVRSVGNIGVDLFFVLSGFLIYGMIMRKETPFLIYLQRRLQRIYPTFIVVFVIYLLLSFAFPHQSKIPGDMWSGFIYIVENFLLLPGLFNIEPIITVAWSLSYEFLYYLIMPMVVFFLRLKEWKPLYRVVLFVMLTVVMFWFFSQYGGPLRLTIFIAGILLFEAMQRKNKLKLPPVGLVAVMLAIFSVVGLKALGLVGWWNTVLIYILFFIFCFECFSSSGLTRWLFSGTYLRWLGNMSYSYYLIHGLSLKFIFLVVAFIYPPAGSDVVVFWVMLPIAFLWTLIPSTVLFLMVEKPYSLRNKPLVPKHVVDRLRSRLKFSPD